MPTMTLAKFASELKYEDLPQPVIEKAKAALQDCVSVAAFVCHHTVWGRIISDFAATEGGCQPDATIIGLGKKTVAGKAALANGTMSLGFEYEDVHIRTIAHPLTMIVPAALAMAEKKKASGKDLLVAIVAGYEVIARIGRAVGKSYGKPIFGLGRYTHPRHGAFAAAVAAGKILKLDPEKMAMVLGMAGEQSAGSLQSHDEGAMSRRWHSGHAAEGGVDAALLIDRGFTAPKHILEGKYGYYKVLGSDFEPSVITESLGKDWEIMYTWFKYYPCWGGSHAGIDALLALRQEHNIDPAQVDRIVGFLPEISTVPSRWDFPTIVAAQYSLPYVLAVAMLRGRFTLDDITEETIRDPKIVAYAQKVAVDYDEGLMEKYKGVSLPGGVTIKMKDGREFSKTVGYCKGDAKNPMTSEEHKAKFDGLAAKAFPKKQAEELYAAIHSVERLKDVSELGRLLGPKA